MVFSLFKLAGDDELDALLDEFGVWNKRPLDVESAFGKVYFGQYDGTPVALKIEPRDSNSAEYRVIGALTGGDRVAFRMAVPHLPELIFAIIKTGWLPRYRPEQREYTELVPYETLSRSVSGIDEGTRVSLRRALDWLVARGVIAGDLHSGNVMERPGTGEWVLIDYGYYKLATSNSK